MIYLQQLIIPIFNFFAESPTYCQLPPDSLPIFLDITKTGYGGMYEFFHNSYLIVSINLNIKLTNTRQGR